MKKVLSLLLAVAVLLSACGGADEAEENVEITIPASFFEEEELDPDELIDEALDEGVEDVIENEDGSMTYVMTPEMHQELMAELEEASNETMETIKNDEQMVSIVDITANEDYSEFTMIVDQEAFENSFDGFAVLALGMSGMYYQLFSGVDEEDFQVTINIEDEETGEVFDTIEFPADAEEDIEEDIEEDLIEEDIE
ncbi:hypothetical protein [Texcoconibacillus texcoconensis]|uniref:Antigen I/II N-terminal domain-containing protein n=1 Tax=Texcoconibacillus texcoconensis TaxID=1095777 RepID=A0A840QU14_9BACI|nr:hypothetical protein [Texcoconibacillus texcoconensis]MBB5175046.1 hypothetical protein [Texcoconibacillus texcoconensis]